MRAAEASRKEKEKKEAEQKLREDKEATELSEENDVNATVEEDNELLDGKVKTQSNGIYTDVVKNYDDNISLVEDINDNDISNIIVLSNSQRSSLGNFNDVRLDITAEDDKVENPLLSMKTKDSLEKIHFETGL